MRAFGLFCFLGIALSTQALNSQRKLIPRSTEDDNKQILKGEVTITQVSATCIEATQSIQTSCDKNDTVQLQQSVTSVQVSVTHLKTIVESFDGQRAMTHQTTVVGIFSSYFTMINTISKTPDGKQACQNQLVHINQAFISISSVYTTMGIDLRNEFKKEGSQYNEDAFKQLGLSPPFADERVALADGGEQPADDGKEQDDDGEQDV